MHDRDLTIPAVPAQNVGTLTREEYLEYDVELDQYRADMAAEAPQLSIVRAVIANLRSDQPWRDAAACRGKNPSTLVPEKGVSTRGAKEICATCVVIEPCLEYALGDPSSKGVWAGTSEKERKRLREARRRTH